MKILINGCSFTAYNNQWPRHFSLDHVNIAQPGHSNENIFFTTMQQLQKTYYDTVIIMWTFLERTSMSTANHENIDILVSSPIKKVKGDSFLNKEEINGSDIEKALKRFRNDYFKYFYSKEIQEQKLDVYKTCVEKFCNRAIHLNVNDIKGLTDSTGHPTSETSKKFAKKVMEQYFNE